jgi:hypothetical protein
MLADEVLESLKKVPIFEFLDSKLSQLQVKSPGLPIYREHNYLSKERRN